MADEPELKPCPFCGSRAEYMKIYDYNDRDFFMDVRCSNVNCYLADGADWHWKSKKDAATIWNRRTPLDTCSDNRRTGGE